MHPYTHIYACICIFTYTHLHIYKSIYSQRYTFKYVYIYIYICTCICKSRCIDIYMYVYRSIYVEDDVHIPCFVVACYAVSCVAYITLFVRFAGTLFWLSQASCWLKTSATDISPSPPHSRHSTLRLGNADFGKTFTSSCGPVEFHQNHQPALRETSSVLRISLD